MTSDPGILLARNSVYSILRILIPLPIYIVTTAFIVKSLGKEQFAVWALAGVLTSYVQLSDFGITEGLVKFIAEHHARNDTNKISEYISTAALFFLTLFLPVFALLYLAIPYITRVILGIPPNLQAESVYIFRLSIIILFANLLIGTFGALISGLQRMEYSSICTIFTSLIFAAGVFYFLSKGYGLVGLVYSNAFSSLFTLSYYYIYSKKLLPSFRVNPISLFRIDALQNILNYGWKINVIGLTQLFIFQFDRIVLSNFIGLTSVGYYELGNRISFSMRGVIATFFAPLVPATSSISVTSRDEFMAGLYRRSFKYMALICLPISVLIISLSKPFFLLWMGPGYDISAYSNQILMAAYAINLFMGPGAYILSGANKPQIGMFSTILAGSLNIILCIVLVNKVGYYGVPLSILISLSAALSLFFYLLHRNISGITWKFYYGCLGLPLLLSLTLGCILFIVNIFLPPINYGVLLIESTVYVFIFAMFLYNSGYLDEFDKALLKRFLSGKLLSTRHP